MWNKYVACCRIFYLPACPNKIDLASEYQEECASGTGGRQIGSQINCVRQSNIRAKNKRKTFSVNSDKFESKHIV